MIDQGGVRMGATPESLAKVSSRDTELTAPGTYLLQVGKLRFLWVEGRRPGGASSATLPAGLTVISPRSRGEYTAPRTTARRRRPPAGCRSDRADRWPSRARRVT